MLAICLLAYLCTALHAEYLRATEPDSQMEGYIVNGVVVPVAKYPYFALITRNGRVHCGGTIISDRLILTAAHCLLRDEDAYYPLHRLKVKLGASTVKDGIEYDICKLQAHEKYNKLGDWDIGLILLTKKIKFSPKVQKGNLATEGWRRKAHRLTVIGFGATETNSSQSNRLRMTKLKYISRAQCERSPDNFRKVPPYMFCLIGYKLNGACYGDSGSPVIWRGMVVGLVSRGRSYKCGTAVNPTEYIDVASLTNWIDHTKAILQNSASMCHLVGSKKKLGEIELIIYRGSNPTASLKHQ